MSASTAADPAAHDHDIAASGGAAASRLGQFSWALFEWARNPYVLLITIYIYAPYFSETLVGDPVRGQAYWGDISALGGALIAVLAPFLGAIADLGGRRKPWIFAFTFLMAVATYALWFAVPDGVMMPLIVTAALIVIANVSFDFTAVFHNAMLPDICAHKRVGGLSGLGLALGNLAGLIILLFMLWAFALPGAVDWGFVPSQPLFGLDQAAHEHVRISGPIAAVWLVVFALPLFFFTPDRARSGMPMRAAMRAGVGRVVKTIADLRHYRNVALYLAARMFYNDGKTAILTFGGIYAAGTFGWHTIQIGTFGIILAIAGTFGAWLGGKLDDRLGPKRVIAGSLMVLLFAVIAILLVGRDSIFFIEVAPPQPGGGLFAGASEKAYLILGCMIGAAGGPLQAASRTLLIRLAPKERIAQYFGLFALTGKVTSFIGPLLIGIVTAATASQKAGMAVLVLFFVSGMALLMRVREP